MNSLKQYPLTSCERELNMELTCSEKVDVDEEIRYTTYGLRLLDETGRVLLSYEDVDSRREYVERFLSMCVGHDIHPLHIPDLLEDYMAQ